jgi:hypothetical protein
MTPASESGDETIGFSLQPNANAATNSSIGSTATVETVTPGSPNALPQPAANPPATNAAPAASDTTSTTTDTTQPASTGASTDPNAAQPASTTPAAPANTSQESTSKKKGGLRKIIPF